MSGGAAFRHPSASPVQRSPSTAACGTAAAPPALLLLPGLTCPGVPWSVVCGLWSPPNPGLLKRRKLEFFPVLDPQTRERFRSPTRRSPNGDQSPIIGNAHSRHFTSLKLRQDLQIPARRQRFAPTTFPLHLAFPGPDRGILSQQRTNNTNPTPIPPATTGLAAIPPRHHVHGLQGPLRRCLHC